MSGKKDVSPEQTQPADEVFPEALDDAFADAFDLSAPPKLNWDGEGAVAVVLAYNEMLRFPHFLDFHRRMGVRHFLVVDNDSNDGTAAFLDAQPDVTRFPASKPYSRYKSQWRHVLCDMYLQGRWAFFPDVDELLVYPGWPDVPLATFLGYCDEHGYEGVFTSMVDMYSDLPLKDLTYASGQPFLEACPFFDGDGYRLMAISGWRTTHYPTPSWNLYGGPRERLFSVQRKRQATQFDQWVLRRFFSAGRDLPAGDLSRRIERLAGKLIRGALPRPAPLMSKVPLIRWRKGYRFMGGVHNVSGRIELAPDWAALLHFKYLSDFAEKTAEAIRRGQHDGGASHYKLYDARMGTLVEKGPLYGGSRRFTGVADLQRAGLMRVSPDCAAKLGATG